MNVPLFKVFMAPDAAGEAARVLASGYVGQGPECEAFESELSARLKWPHLAVTNSCTSALQIAFRLIAEDSLPQGRDEVISTPLTCTATNWPILANGLKIRWADVDPFSCNISVPDLEQKLSPRTAAVCAVHWGGAPVDRAGILSALDHAGRRHGIRPAYVEDAAHALGTTIGGCELPTGRAWVAYSFQAIKHVTSIEGGALACPDEHTCKAAKLLRWYGIDRNAPSDDLRCENDVGLWGYKANLNDVCAAIGRANLRHLDAILKVHRDNAAFFRRAIPARKWMVCHPLPGVDSACWLFTVHTNRRDELRKKLAAHGIGSSRVHARNDLHAAVRQFREPLSGVSQSEQTRLCIPVGWWVTEEDRERIANIIAEDW